MLFDRTLKLSFGWLAVVAGLTAPAIARADEQPAPSGISVLLAPLLAGWITSSRDAAIAAGVAPMPEAIRKALEGYVPAAVLAKIRWRVGPTGDLTLQQSAIGYGDVPAMTLGNVIVFKDRGEALEDPTLWAHEIKHVLQFDEWGGQGFATRYLVDYEAVELAASEYRWQYMKQAGLVPAVSTTSR